MEGSTVPFHRLLVPTDFSEHAGWAVDQAIELARRSGARIDLLHTYRIPSPYDVVLPDDVAVAVRDAAARRLLGVFERIQKRGVDVEMHLKEQPLPEAVVSLAAEFDSDCVVIGTRGLTGLKHVLLGSNAERTLRVAPCPVLTVGQEPTAGAGGPRKILVPIDFSETSKCGLDLTGQLLGGTEGAHATLLHVHSLPVGLGPYVDLSAEEFVGLPARLRESLESLAQPLEDAGVETDVRVVEGHAPSAAITATARDEEYDWIVMGTHGRTGLPHAALGSVAERVVRSAPCPTLTVKRAT
jgi:nucleotide-binding universal stress UspA family protein